MPDELSSKSLRKPRILLSPLDWGLGHTTRCIPVIKELLRLECDVWLAADGMQKRILQEEFPELNILEIPGYNIRYSKSNTGFSLRMMAQVPKILDIIIYENNWLRTKLPVYEFDAIISDNRYGFRHRKADSVFMTHQLAIQTGMGGFFNWIANRFNYYHIHKFKHCWVADAENENSLAGKLSHPKHPPKIELSYIGTLSRFKKTGTPEIKNHLLIILSGPEPQRTLLEKMIIKDILNYEGTATIVRGLPGGEMIIPSTNNLKFYNHLGAEALNEEMEKAEIVISRSGYSTIMDIARLNKKSILIPTPGQAEQEYLSKRLSKSRQAFCIEQKRFSLMHAVEQARSFSYASFPGYNDEKMKKVIAGFVKQLEFKIGNSAYAEFLG